MQKKKKEKKRERGTLVKVRVVSRDLHGWAGEDGGDRLGEEVSARRRGQKDGAGPQGKGRVGVGCA